MMPAPRFFAPMLLGTLAVPHLPPQAADRPTPPKPAVAPPSPALLAHREKLREAREEKCRQAAAFILTGPKTRDEVTAYLNASRSHAWAILDALREGGWIENVRRRKARAWAATPKLLQAGGL